VREEFEKWYEANRLIFGTQSPAKAVWLGKSGVYQGAYIDIAYRAYLAGSQVREGEWTRERPTEPGWYWTTWATASRPVLQFYTVRGLERTPEDWWWLPVATPPPPVATPEERES
jgi:hypothetical protein